MANEVVKHHNDLNTVIMKMDSGRDEFLFAIIAKAGIKTLLTLFSINIS